MAMPLPTAWYINSTKIERNSNVERFQIQFLFFLFLSLSHLFIHSRVHICQTLTFLCDGLIPRIVRFHMDWMAICLSGKCDNRTTILQFSRWLVLHLNGMSFGNAPLPHRLLFLFQSYDIRMLSFNSWLTFGFLLAQRLSLNRFRATRRERIKCETDVFPGRLWCSVWRTTK